jgi:hypothetical protein
MADEKEDVIPPTPREPSSGGKRGKAKVEIKVELDLDNLEEFDLRGDGIKITHVVSN